MKTKRDILALARFIFPELLIDDEVYELIADYRDYKDWCMTTQETKRRIEKNLLSKYLFLRFVKKQLKNAYVDC